MKRSTIVAGMLALLPGTLTAQAIMQPTSSQQEAKVTTVSYSATYAAQIHPQAETIRLAQKAAAHMAHLDHLARVAHAATLAAEQAVAQAEARAAAAAQVAAQTAAQTPAASTGATASSKTWGISYGYPNFCGDGDNDGWDVNCATRNVSAAQAPVTTGDREPDGDSDDTRAAAPAHVAAVSASPANVSTSGMSSFQQCVITRESGDRPQVMNATGHYGLYQFDKATWISGGGSAASFGHASVAEQNRVFANVFAARGIQPWNPSDGCH